MRRPALAKGHMRSASCSPAISDERGHASQIAVEPTPLTSRGSDHATSTTGESTISPQTPIFDTKELVSNTSETTSGLNEEASSLSQLPTSQPESRSNPTESTISLTDSTAALEELPTSQPEPPSDPTESTISLRDSTAASNELPSSLEELEEGEILSTSPTTNFASPPPNPQHSIAPLPPHQRVRASNPSPQPILGQSQHTPLQPNGRLGRKRKELDGQLESQNKKRKKKDNPEDKTHYKSSRQLGHNFVGFIVLVDDYRAWDIANKILQLPVPQNVRKRLVYFCDASIRSFKWDGKGVYYPLSVESSATVELFAIACTLELAICEIYQERATIVPNPRVDRTFFQQQSSLIRYHVHRMTKEVFVFTDDINALRRIGGRLSYDPNGDMASHLEAIARHSKTLNRLGVHVELHLTPGNSKVPGNMAADAMARKAQNELFVQTAISWPVME
ncbi:hypothetical protein N7449_008020 [Penicillium cf. viridicatum]|uniref:RNase H type-1 domain-containing protein n=1 Tax=Penicillium cf. viridicatum TaxID=2972119 RepID=A0A9W9JK47_9EURO|nr:hypothetical protein N7449_008020 [Penicillium cf. viridicatum]